MNRPSDSAAASEAVAGESSGRQAVAGESSGRQAVAGEPLAGGAFAEEVAGLLADLPGVRAVALGGSRATGTARPDSDWDFAVYYRGGGFDPQSLRDLGWAGEIFPIGGWGGGVFNGGAWLQAGERHVDVHYRDLDDVEHRLAEAREGRFDVERLPFHLAGVPTYIVVAELALHRVLRGELPAPSYPAALRRAAPRRWWSDAQATLGYARTAHAGRGHLADTAGAIATAACQTAHAVLAAAGQWVTNEKTLLDRAGLRGIDGIVAGLSPEPGHLITAIDSATTLLQASLAPATALPYASMPPLTPATARPDSPRPDL